MEILYKTFKTPRNYYVYDRTSNKILLITKEDYDVLNEKNVSIEFLQKFQSKGFLLENKMETVEHPETERIENILQNRMEYLLLQVTQRCNLRCHYCVYGGGYENRMHSELDMDFGLAQKAIDYYILHSSQEEELVLGFYGGEPLLKMDLIRDCVNYIKKSVPDRRVRFTLTTNGTLLNLEKAHFFYNNNFSIVISLDGSREDHDKNRVFKDSGKGTFDVIMKNLKEIHERLPEFMGNVSFNTVLNYNCDFSCVKDYYNTNEFVRDAQYVLNLVEENGAIAIGNFSEKFLIEYRYEQFLLFMYMLGKIEKEQLLKSQLDNMLFYRDFYTLLKDSDLLGKKGHHNGPCVPGGRRLFVTVDGSFYPCEKVPEEPVMKIGDISNGIDIDACKKLLNIGKVSEEACKKCWALRICDQCASRCVENGTLSRGKKLCQCVKSKKIALEKLKVISMLKEFDYDFEEAII